MKMSITEIVVYILVVAVMLNVGIQIGLWWENRIANEDYERTLRKFIKNVQAHDEHANDKIMR